MVGMSGSVVIGGVCIFHGTHYAVMLLMAHVTPMGSIVFWWWGWRKCFLWFRVPTFNIFVDFHGVLLLHCWCGFCRHLQSSKCVWHYSCHYEGCWEHVSTLHSLDP